MRTRSQKRGISTSISIRKRTSPGPNSRPESIEKAHETRGKRTGERYREIAEDPAVAQDYFRKALEGSLAIGLMVIGLSGRQVHVSQAFCKMVGWSHDELIGRHFPFPYWPPEEAGCLARYFESVMMETEHRPAWESRFRRKDGTVFHVLLMYSPLKDGRGKLSGWAFSVGDLSERKASERAAVGYERRLASLSSQLLAAHEEERRVIACEIHDSICSSLTAVGFGLQKLNQEDPNVKSLMQITASAIKESRRIMMALRPSILDDLGIVETINWFCRDFQRVYSNVDITADVHVLEKAIPDGLKIVIFRIMQEAFNNIAKHSRANSVSLFLKVPGYIELIIKDNGAGFDIHKVCNKKNSDHGIGLESMRHRAEISGGTFEIESAKGMGTTIRVCWPVKRRELRGPSSSEDQYSLFISNI
jgi:PAS domain S-box-containing protein